MEKNKPNYATPKTNENKLKHFLSKESYTEEDKDDLLNCLMKDKWFNNNVYIFSSIEKEHPYFDVLLEFNDFGYIKGFTQEVNLVGKQCIFPDCITVTLKGKEFLKNGGFKEENKKKEKASKKDESLKSSTNRSNKANIAVAIIALISLLFSLYVFIYK